MVFCYMQIGIEKLDLKNVMSANSVGDHTGELSDWLVKMNTALCTLIKSLQQPGMWSRDECLGLEM